jgi:hypothetical protein
MNNNQELRAKDISAKYGIHFNTAYRRLNAVKSAYGISGRPVLWSEYKMFYKIVE